MNGNEYFVYVSLRRLDSARGCRKCRQPISMDDAFGLSEGICHSCRGIVPLGRPRRRPLGWLRRAA